MALARLINPRAVMAAKSLRRTTMSQWYCRPADYQSRQDCAAILALMDCYAADPMGGGEPLAASVRQRLCAALAAQPGALTILAFEGELAIGLVNALQGFSTFKAQPLLNIHDVIVRPERRGRGVCVAMLAAVEELARGRGCCKLTLEVLEGNTAARRSYQGFGFVDYQLRAEYGSARFMGKPVEINP